MSLLNKLQNQAKALRDRAVHSTIPESLRAKAEGIEQAIELLQESVKDYREGTESRVGELESTPSYSDEEFATYEGMVSALSESLENVRYIFGGLDESTRTTEKA